MCAHSAVAPLVHDQTWTIVSSLPGLGGVDARGSAPEIDHASPTGDDRHGGAHFAAIGEVSDELVADALEPPVPDARDEPAGRLADQATVAGEGRGRGRGAAAEQRNGERARRGAEQQAPAREVDGRAVVVDVVGVVGSFGSMASSG